MAARQRSTKAKREGPSGSHGAGGNLAEDANQDKDIPRGNTRRRERYQHETAYRDKALNSSRKTYQKKAKTGRKPQQPSLPFSPNLREVIRPGGDPEFMECFTVPETADALGKSKLAFRRWIGEQLIPAPAMVDTTRGYAQYTAQEVIILRERLAIHEETYKYLHSAHHETIHGIWQSFEAYRKGENCG